jgi:hypothetical protein
MHHNFSAIIGLTVGLGEFYHGDMIVVNIQSTA